jgi:multiple sugar transport system ATP-binding protein
MPATTGFEIQVEVVEELGADAFVYGKPIDSSVRFNNASDENAQVIVRWDPKSPPKSGQNVTVSAKSDAIHLFSATNGDRI